MSSARELSRLRDQIARRVRDLRISRRLTQRELASRLDLSQSRLSELEQAKGSFSAEQFIILQRIFNVTSHDLAGVAQEPQSDLQNALARLGASHMHESASLPSERLENAQDVVREALVDGTPRVVTSLAPVLAIQAHELNLFGVEAALGKLGLAHRLGWLVENTHAAIVAVRKAQPRQAGRFRGETTLQIYLSVKDTEAERARRAAAPLDVLDRTIRSPKTLREVEQGSSEISRKWRLVTTIQPEDFVHALEAADVSSH